MGYLVTYTTNPTECRVSSVQRVSTLECPSSVHRVTSSVHRVVETKNREEVNIIKVN